MIQRNAWLWILNFRIRKRRRACQILRLFLSSLKVTKEPVQYAQKFLDSVRHIQRKVREHFRCVQSNIALNCHKVVVLLRGLASLCPIPLGGKDPALLVDWWTEEDSAEKMSESLQIRDNNHLSPDTLSHCSSPS